MTSNDLAELKNFFGAYFHEDWEMYSTEPDDVVALFLRAEPNPEEVARIATQIHVYVRAHVNDEDLDRGLLKELGCYYSPNADGYRVRDWLLHVVALLRKK